MLKCGDSNSAFISCGRIWVEPTNWNNKTVFFIFDDYITQSASHVNALAQMNMQECCFKLILSHYPSLFFVHFRQRTNETGLMRCMKHSFPALFRLQRSPANLLESRDSLKLMRIWLLHFFGDSRQCSQVKCRDCIREMGKNNTSLLISYSIKVSPLMV